MFCFVVVVVVFSFFLRNTLGTHLSYLPWSLTADNDLEVNRNLNNKPNLFNWVLNNIRFFRFKKSRENHTNTSLDLTLLTFLSFSLFSSEIIFCFLFLPRILAYDSRWYKSKIMLFKFFLHIVFGDSDVTALFKNTRTLRFKSRLHNWAFFTAVNHNYDHKQRIFKHKPQNGSKPTNHKSQTMTF